MHHLTRLERCEGGGGLAAMNVGTRLLQWAGYDMGYGKALCGTIM